ncbi:MAG: hypothetical protein JJW00_01500 [Sulfurimonas sp.]|nr:hypothetical protein [Sulfurimonas sp.]
MSDGFEDLKGIGAQNIYEQTHITRRNAQAILDENFEQMTKMQTLGFVSILEREYEVSLGSLRETVEKYFDVQKSSEVHELQENTKVFVTPKRNKNYTLLYAGVTLLIFALAVFFTLDISSKAAIKISSYSVDDSAIESAKESIEENITKKAELAEDKNETTEIVVPKPEIAEVIKVIKPIEVPEVVKLVEVPEVVEVVEAPKVAKVEKSLKIIPKGRLWIGYIDLQTYTKKQKIFSGELDIDPSKDWIMALGHGYVKVVIDGNTTEFKQKSNIRLLYKDSKISKITFKEFKKLNRGNNKW